jgi:hypothetical protein
VRRIDPAGRALEASRRVGWAKAYAAEAEVEQYRVMISALRYDLVPMYVELVDAVLYKPLVAFGLAFRSRRMLDDFQRRHG